MNNISYYKLQAKNLFHDIKLDFMQDDENYIFASKFFEVNTVVTDFDVECDDFSLMKAQHVIAKMSGLKRETIFLNATKSYVKRFIG